MYTAQPSAPLTWPSHQSAPCVLTSSLVAGVLVQNTLVTYSSQRRPRASGLLALQVSALKSPSRESLLTSLFETASHTQASLLPSLSSPALTPFEHVYILYILLKYLRTCLSHYNSTKAGSFVHPFHCSFPHPQNSASISQVLNKPGLNE